MNKIHIGYLYASKNESTPGALKLGKTLNPVDTRAKRTVTGSPYPMVPVHYAEFKLKHPNDLLALEKRMHRHPNIFPKKIYHGGGKEWFMLDVEIVKSVLLELQLSHAETRAWLATKNIEIARHIEAEKSAKKIAAEKANAERNYYALLEENLTLRGMTFHNLKNSEYKINSNNPVAIFTLDILRKYNFNLQHTRESYEWKQACLGKVCTTPAAT